MTIAKSLLLAGGLGTRLKPVTDAMPKCLVDVGGESLLDYWVASIRGAGVQQVLINTHHFAEQVRSYIEEANRGFALNLVETYEASLLGSAGTIAANRGWMDDADICVIVYVDNLSDVDLSALIQFHLSHTDPLTMMLFRASDPSACGIAELDQDDRVISFVEKPDEPRSDLANAGVYVVDAAAWREIGEMNVMDIGFDVLPQLVGRMRGWLWEGYHLDIGTHEALAKARTDVGSLFGAAS
jgi:NDP-sugar pyrophosphorylase family protein